MLPPQLQQAARPRSLSVPATMTVGSPASSLLRCSVAASSSRSLWAWRRSTDYTSHIDPQFQRFCRYRTLKTRAKLLEKLRRRGRWDWDANERPFFSPRQARFASHVGGGRWKYNEDGSGRKEPTEVIDESGFELSQREKEWKQQMEAMRNRIEQDPYEAVFGKRFEPFWSPLVPTWMRGEMGLSRRSPIKESARSYQPTSTEASIVDALKKHKQPRRDVETAYPNGQLTEYAYPENKKPASKPQDPDSPNGQLTSYSYSRKKPTSSNESPDSPNGQLTSYSYSSSTSWDSWTKKARRDEWDSISGQRRRFEYDPISNRMVQVQVQVPVASSPNAAIEGPISTNSTAKKSLDSPGGCAFSAVDGIPVNSSAEPRKAIPVPTNTTDVRENSTAQRFQYLVNSVHGISQNSPAAVSETPEKALDTLTAEDVRASVGKIRQDRNTSPSESGRLSKEKHGNKHASNETRVDKSPETPPPAGLRKIGNGTFISALGEGKFVSQQLPGTKIQYLLRPNTSNELCLDSTSKVPFTLQTSVDRMQTKRVLVTIEPDDSAAHESTGEALEYQSSNVPKDWDKQTDVLQTDRINRTRGSSLALTNMTNASLTSKDRWIDIMNARKAEYEAKVLAHHAATEARDAEKNMRLKKVNAVLDAEVKDQKLRFMAYKNRYAHGALADIHQRIQQASPRNSELNKDTQHETKRYQEKIRDLRKELDTTFKQSSVHSEKHLERIRDLEKELALARSFGHDTLRVERDRYMQKTKDLKQELDRTFKQSSVNAEMQVERIRDLERELEGARSSKGKLVKGIEATRAEGDFCTNVTKYAKNSSKWYKKPSYIPEATGKLGKTQPDQVERSSGDETLAHEIRDIYEATYGPIDTMRSESKVVDVEKDTDLGKALADYEKEQEYDFRKPQRTLEAEIAAEERAAHEAQALLDPYPMYSSEAKQNNASKLVVDRDVYSARLMDENTAEVTPEQAAPSSAGKIAIQWEDPPVYKVLAYDSGNDLLTTAETSSNVTGIETPISIPEALSQLYQPARFVPHFAELQREGFQVIYGTKDLLVFKKVKNTTIAAQHHLTIADHGLVKDKSTAYPESKTYPAGVNPIDGMSRSIESDTGSFASPTGFVGDRWDSISASEASAQFSGSGATYNSPDAPFVDLPKDDEIHIRHYPRVRREEHVFSGSRLDRRRGLKREAKDTKRKWRSWRSRVQWALGVGLGASAVAYTVGAVAERKERKEMERWQQILEGKKARWE